LTLEAFLGKFEKKVKAGNGFNVVCPSHPDRSPSLSVTEKDGKILLTCRAGCSTHSIVQSMGLSMRDLFTEEKPKKERSKIVATYPYEGPDGRVEFEICRTESKEFLARHKDGDKTVWNLNGQTRYPFRLPKVLLAAKEHKTVWIAEGEKDVLALEQAGVTATCNNGGAEKWTVGHAKYLEGCKGAVIVRDKDKAGVAHGKAVALTLSEVGIPYKIVEAAEGKDAADHLAAGRTLKEFVEIVEGEDSPALAEPPAFTFVRVRDVLAMPPKPMLATGLVGVKDRCMVFGVPGVGKTFAVLDMLLDLCNGTAVCNQFEATKRCTIVYATNEGRSGLPQRLQAAMMSRYVEAQDIESRFITVFDMPQLYDENSPRAVGKFIEEYERQVGTPLDILVLDTLNKASLGSEENNNSEQAVVCDTLAMVGERLGCSTWLVHHSDKVRGEPRGASALIGDMDLVLKVSGVEDMPGLKEMSLYKGKDIPAFDAVTFKLNPYVDSLTVNWLGGAVSEDQNVLGIALSHMFVNREQEWWTAAELSKATGKTDDAIRMAFKREMYRNDSQIQKSEDGAMYRRAVR
jgi:hypothetical protein